MVSLIGVVCQDLEDQWISVILADQLKNVFSLDDRSFAQSYFAVDGSAPGKNDGFFVYQQIPGSGCKKNGENYDTQHRTHECQKQKHI